MGHVISENGVVANPKKIESIVSWPRPTNLKQLRGILGLAGYYRRFIQGFASIVAPLTDLLKKDSYKWTDKANSAFEELKKVMTTTPVLLLPDFNSTFVIETDASNVGIGAVLMQGGKPIGFFSKKIGPRL